MNLVGAGPTDNDVCLIAAEVFIGFIQNPV